MISIRIVILWYFFVINCRGKKQARSIRVSFIGTSFVSNVTKVHENELILINECQIDEWICKVKDR